MSTGRHENGRSKTPAGLVAGMVSLTAGVILVPVALIELMRYSPYEDPGAGQTGLWLMIFVILLAGVPLVVAGARAGAYVGRSYMAWKKTLTQRERMALNLAEFAALGVAHLAWRDHNQDESARLTASAMGDVRETQPADQV